MRTDLQIQRDIIDELAFEPRVNHAEIAVSVKGGVATLAGKVDSYAQKSAAERAATRISGVRALADDLDVRIPGDRVRSDTDIAHAAANVLRWHTELPADRITAVVENGMITLQGTTDWQFQREAAQRAVQNLVGVRGVFNTIVVAPSVAPADVKAKIESALKRNAELDAKRITVESSDGFITLRGSVRSWAEKRDAWKAAWAARGVRGVDDQLTIMT